MFTADAPSPSTEQRTTYGYPYAVRDIVPQMSPTQPDRPMHAARSDISVLDRDTGRTTSHERLRPQRSTIDRSESEAAHYLASLHSNGRPASRQRPSRPSTAEEETMPSLSSTPMSPSNSSVAYTPASAASHRPFTARKNRWSSSYANHSIDLVTPITDTPTAPSSMSTVTEISAREGTSIPGLSIKTAEGTEMLSYEKRKTLSGTTISPARGSLKQLFCFDEMRSSAKQV